VPIILLAIKEKTSNVVRSSAWTGRLCHCWGVSFRGDRVELDPERLRSSTSFDWRDVMFASSCVVDADACPGSQIGSLPLTRRLARITPDTVIVFTYVSKKQHKRCCVKRKERMTAHNNGCRSERRERKEDDLSTSIRLQSYEQSWPSRCFRARSREAQF
jgi:hypothetical protein